MECFWVSVPGLSQPTSTGAPGNRAVLSPVCSRVVCFCSCITPVVASRIGWERWDGQRRRIRQRKKRLVLQRQYESQWGGWERPERKKNASCVSMCAMAGSAGTWWPRTPAHPVSITETQFWGWGCSTGCCSSTLPPHPPRTVVDGPGCSELQLPGFSLVFIFQAERTLVIPKPFCV